MFTIPNLLSVTRGLCAPVFALAIYWQSWHIAIALFLYAIVSDLLDGPLARRAQQTSNFGGRLDHSADALFVFCGLTGFAVLGELTWVLALFQMIAFLEYAFFGASLGSSLRASKLGRINGILYFVIIGYLLFLMKLEINSTAGLSVLLFAWALVITTFVSIALRMSARRSSRQPSS